MNRVFVGVYGLYYEFYFYAYCRGYGVERNIYHVSEYSLQYNTVETIAYHREVVCPFKWK